MPIVEQAKVPLLNAGSSALKITDPGNPYTFRIMPNEVMQGVDIATNAYNKLNARTAVLLYENTNAGIGNAKVFNDTFTSLGGKILADIGFGRDVNDFTSIATRIAGSLSKGKGSGQRRGCRPSSCPRRATSARKICSSSRQRKASKHSAPSSSEASTGHQGAGPGSTCRTRSAAR